MYPRYQVLSSGGIPGRRIPPPGVDGTAAVGTHTIGMLSCPIGIQTGSSSQVEENQGFPRNNFLKIVFYRAILQIFFTEQFFKSSLQCISF